MCGIAGKMFFDPPAKVETRHIQAMLAPIFHRGPDASGVFLDGNAGLGHARLSIIDLNSGAQPMCNEDESVWIVFNGEIYNFKELRSYLLARGHRFRSQSDTEVIIHLYEELGPECVERLRGMFAFALWDKSKQRLFLARDRVGIKPLYYYSDSQAIWFGSEIKAILTDESIPRELDLMSVRKFFAFNYLPGEETLLKGVRKLLPGHFILADSQGVRIRQYWDLRFTDERWSMPYGEAVEELYSLTRQCVKDHMMADVPVGVLLSGGMDSTAVCSLAVQQTNKKLHTFTIGFNDQGVVDERPYAKTAADSFGTEHHELSFGAKEFWDTLPLYVRHMEEPVCEPPAIALYHISKLAREHVKVVLSGEGGDEAFAGYPNYVHMLGVERWKNKLGPLSAPVGSFANLLGARTGRAGLARYAHALNHELPEHYFSRTSTPESLFNKRAQSIFTPEFLEATAGFDPAEYIARLLAPVKKQPLLNKLLYIDTKTWLPDDLLIKADKMTMATSIELRVPLLDHVLLEFAASLPPEFKLHGRETKRILKSAFAKAVPSEILSRKKAGFPVPYGKWLKTEVSDRLRPGNGRDSLFPIKVFQPRKLGCPGLGDCSYLNGKEAFSMVVFQEWLLQLKGGVSR